MTLLTETLLPQVIEAALMTANKPLSVSRLQQLFDEEEKPDSQAIKSALALIGSRCEDRGFELVEVAGGFRFQVRQAVAPWVGRLFEEKPPRYSRATLETLALIVYRQPVTRGEIEEVRGVAVSSQIMRSLLERNWIKVIGHKDVPGRPAMYATTREFLDYFGLKSLENLPTLAELQDPDVIADAFGVPVDEEGAVLSREAPVVEEDNPSDEEGSDAGSHLAEVVPIERYFDEDTHESEFLSADQVAPESPDEALPEKGADPDANPKAPEDTLNEPAEEIAEFIAFDDIFSDDEDNEGRSRAEGGQEEPRDEVDDELPDMPFNEESPNTDSDTSDEPLTSDVKGVNLNNQPGNDDPSLS